ncbi:MAG TPA: pitrilysin family protein [Pseudomonadota bacterium]|nr:pitrilysin family protein [Pseudomonadota bacterium]
MNSYSLLSALVMGSLLLAPPVGAAPVVVKSDWRQIKPPPLHAMKPQQPVRVVLDNGIVLLLQQDKELPLMTMNVMIRGGVKDEPFDKTGLSDIFAESWRSGGTKSRTGDQIDDLLALRAAQIETGSEATRTTLTTHCLKKDFADVLGLAVELLREPEFRQDKIEIAKRQVYTAISRRNDESSEIAGRESTKLAYGKDHPLARQEEYATIAGITRDDLLLWHRRFVHSGNLIVGISGDFDPDELLALLKQKLATLQQSQKVTLPELGFVPTRPGLYFVPKREVNQSSIHLVQLGTTRKNPDHYALEVMNEILGGGFWARLFSNIRTKQGLAYNVGGGVGLGWEFPSLYKVAMSTKSQTTGKSITALFEQVQGMLMNPPTPDELQKAKDAILNSFVFKFDSKAKILSDRMRLEFAGYPADYTEKYADQIQKVTLEDVKRVAQKYLNPGGFAVLVVGNPDEIGDQLTQLKHLGPVQTVDVTIPPPPPRQNPAQK